MQSRRVKLTAFTVIGLFSLVTSIVGYAEEKRYGPGVTDIEIKIGNTVPYSGPASGYGVYGTALAGYFKMINEHGGINGRKITLISLDNGYSPPKALEGTRRLVEQDQVLAIMGTLGTPTNAATQRYLQEAHVPNLAIISGASRFNDPEHFPWTVPGFASYRTEGKIYGRYLLATDSQAKIAVLYQNDDLGRDYLAGLKEGLGARAETMIVAAASYEVADPTVDSQMVSLRASGADVLVEFTNLKASARAIRKTYDIGWRPLQIVGVTGSAVAGALKPAGLEKSIGIITAFDGKDPSDRQWADDPDMIAYRDFMQKYYPDGDQNNGINFLGYSVGFTIAEMLRRCGDDLTREHLVDIATHIRGLRTPNMLPGTTMNMSPTDYDGFKQFQLFRFDGERYVPFGSLIGGDVTN
jgi:branched-chain amino acid transport system substrate-binding protein